MSKGRLAMIKRLALCSLGCLILASSAKPVFADIVYTTSGTTSGGSVSGSATFVISAGKLDVTLTNTSTIHNAADVLTGLSFTLTGGTLTGLTGASAAGVEDCTNVPCSAASGVGNLTDADYGWTLSGAALDAGAGSFKPGGVINPADVASDANPSFTGNHNDYLVGPVTFQLSYAGSPTNVSGITFHWGTAAAGSDNTSGTVTGTGTLNGTSGTVPEPTSIILLSTVFVGIMLIGRKKRQQNA
jgi:hypothetical protein